MQCCLLRCHHCMSDIGGPIEGSAAAGRELIMASLLRVPWWENPLRSSCWGQCHLQHSKIQHCFYRKIHSRHQWYRHYWRQCCLEGSIVGGIIKGSTVLGGSIVEGIIIRCTIIGGAVIRDTIIGDTNFRWAIVSCTIVGKAIVGVTIKGIDVLLGLERWVWMARCLCRISCVEVKWDGVKFGQEHFWTIEMGLKSLGQ